MGTDRAQVAEVAKAIGSTMMPDNEVWTNRFTVPSTSSDNVYVVAQKRSDGSWGCSCWAWRTKRRCKHLEQVLQRLACLADIDAFARSDPPTRKMLTDARAAFVQLDDVRAIDPEKIAAHRRKPILDL